MTADDLLDADRAAARIGVSTKTLGKLRREGSIQCVRRTDHRFLYHPDDCDAYLAGRRGFVPISDRKPANRSRTARVIALPRFSERRA